jgi:hypothetical protein
MYVCVCVYACVFVCDCLCASLRVCNSACGYNGLVDEGVSCVSVARVSDATAPITGVKWGAHASFLAVTSIDRFLRVYGPGGDEMQP